MSRKLWKDVPAGIPDAIFGLVEQFKKDPNEHKVNLSVGAFRDNNGMPYVLPSVIHAEKILDSMHCDKEYAPINGIEEFCNACSELLLGSNSVILAEKKCATVQTISGTGALSLGAMFIRRFLPESTDVFLPNPTWPNHKNIFRDRGFKVNQYRYFDADTCWLNEKGLISDIESMPANSVIVLHACAHNPTGVNLNHEQWKTVSTLIKEKCLIPFFDIAYQGFASGSLDEDAYAVRLFADEGHQMLIAQSLAKNMGLYGERVGTLSIICDSAIERSNIIGQLKMLIRPLYSNPPIHGARIAKTILRDPSLREEWLKDLKFMSGRLLTTRQQFYDLLTKKVPHVNWSHILKQEGMFCFTGLNEAEVNSLIKEFSIYLTQDGRISVCGLTSGNIDYVCDAIATVVNRTRCNTNNHN